MVDTRLKRQTFSRLLRSAALDDPSVGKSAQIPLHCDSRVPRSKHDVGEVAVTNSPTKVIPR